MSTPCPVPGSDLLAYAEGELAAARQEAVAAHLEGCPACREDHESLRALVASQRADP